ncbi:hypothetical protein [Longimicrobium terrae]|uniref:Lipoprotein n=1 Tax=Longimicrobium terrae TaxID=1639882 RepID=A0A841GR80_9BACT|nr:hypothetical protein [Longimicrobium terrae]MBB4635698.1 hypothetical protein [Longimicrobium terrae]MBB6070092.1 hypothetical protein [Longimicrobium terrae]NNC32995.1 hypothetical protein [Longimicrobium terrae]
MSRRSLAAAAGVLLLAAPLASCGRDARAQESAPDAPLPVAAVTGIPTVAGAELVSGFWTGGGESVELFGNGTVLLYRWPARVMGRYQFVTPDRMLIEFPYTGSVPGDYSVSSDGNTLRLCETDRPARCLTLRRAERTAEGTVVRASGTPSRLAPPPEFEGPRPPPAPRDGQGELRLAPQPSRPPAEARSAEVGPLLKQARTLQEVYRLENGRYAATWDELRTAGWEPVPLRWFHPPVIRRATGDQLCIDVQPRDPDLWPVHIMGGGDGQPGRGTCAQQR